MAKNKRASEDLLAKIHAKTAQRLLEMLESGEPLTAQEINAISKFLKDNDITATAEEGTPHANLALKFSEMDAEAAGIFMRPNAGDEDVDDDCVEEANNG